MEPGNEGIDPGSAMVSIPERVWGGLELNSLDHTVGVSLVSIPERVWGGLERPFYFRLG